MKQIDIVQEYDTSATFVSHFVHMAKLYSDRTALMSVQNGTVKEKMTYQELISQCKGFADRVRMILPSVQKPADSWVPVIAICLPSSISLFTSVLGSWLAKCAFCIIDPNQPIEEVRYRIKNIRPAMLITNADMANQLHEKSNNELLIFERGIGTLKFSYDNYSTDLRVLNFEQLVFKKSRDIRSDNFPSHQQLAYIAHTSGSTGNGRSKGVAVDHAGLLGAMQTHLDIMQLTQDERILQFAGQEFDAIIMEMMLAFGTGSCLVTSDIQDRYQLNNLSSLIRNLKISTMIFTPKLLEEYEPLDFPCVKKIILTGEACTKPLLDKWMGSVSIYIGYGLVETTIALTLTPYDGSQISIAKNPMGAMRYWLMNEGAVVNIGRGEVVATGAGLARGYVRDGVIDEELTATRFVECYDPDTPDKKIRVLKTGDEVERLEGGVVVYKSRLDDQVKIAGVRIEPEGVAIQIKSNLDKKFETATKCVYVCAQTNVHNHIRLVAFIQPENEGHEITLDCLTSIFYNDGSVPLSTMPEQFYLLDPNEKYFNSRGKIDKKKIQAGKAGYKLLSAQLNNIQGNEAEQRMLKIWHDHFGHRNINLNSSFEELGGYSLLFIKIVKQIMSVWQVDPLLEELPQPLTVTSLTQHVLKMRYATESIRWVNQVYSDKPLVICCLPIDGNEDSFTQLIQHELFRQDFRFALITQRFQSEGEVFSSLNEYARYLSSAIKLIAGVQPVAFLGWSFGGLSAFAIAAHLKEKYQVITFCGLIDAPAPQTFHFMDLRAHISVIESVIRKTIAGYGCDDLFNIHYWGTKEFDLDTLNPSEKIILLFDDVLKRPKPALIHTDNARRCFSAINTIKQNVLMVLNFFPKPVDLPLTIYTAKKPSVVSDVFRVEVTEWQKLIESREVKVRTYESDHFSIISFPAFREQLKEDMRENITNEDLDALRKKIKQFVSIRQYQDALSLSHRLIGENNYNPNDFSLRARLYAELNRYRYALADVSTALQIDPRCVSAYITKALIYQATSHDVLPAMEAIQKAIDIMLDNHPDMAFSLRIKAELLMKIPTERNQAFQLFRNAIAREPNNAATLACFGLQLMLCEEYSESRVHLEKACQLEPQVDYYKALLREAVIKDSKNSSVVPNASSMGNNDVGLFSGVGTFFSNATAKAKEMIGSVVQSDTTQLQTLLFTAAKEGDVNRIKHCVQQGLSLTQTNKGDRRNILHVACIHGQAQVVLFCIQNKFNIFEYDANGLTAIHLAAERGRYDIIELIFRALDKTQQIQLLELPTIYLQDGKKIIHSAALNPSPQVVNYCLEMGANVNSLTRFRFTPLHFAARSSPEVVRCLIETHRADPNVTNSLGYDSFEWAVRAHQIESAAIMLPQYNTIINCYTLLVSGDPHFKHLMDGDDAFHDQLTPDGFKASNLDKAQMYYCYVYYQYYNDRDSYLWLLACYRLAVCYQTRALRSSNNVNLQSRYQSQALHYLHELLDRLRSEPALAFPNIEKLKNITHRDQIHLNELFQQLFDQLHERVRVIKKSESNVLNCTNLFDIPVSDEVQHLRIALLASYEQILCAKYKEAESQLQALLNDANKLENVEAKVWLTCLCLELLSYISHLKEERVIEQKLIMSVRGYVLQNQPVVEKALKKIFGSNSEDSSILKGFIEIVDERFINSLLLENNALNKQLFNRDFLRELVMSCRYRLVAARKQLQSSLLGPKGSDNSSDVATSNSIYSNLVEIVHGKPSPNQKIETLPLATTYERIHNIASIEDLLPNIEALQKDIVTFCQNYLSIFYTVVKFACSIVGDPSCKYAVCVSGSLANGLPCLYSDIEWFILLEDDSEIIRGYFRNVSNLVQQLMIGMGETAFEVLPNGKSPTPRGFSEDPSGLTPSNSRGYEFITTPQKMALQLYQYKELPVEFTNTLLHSEFLLGEQLLHEQLLGKIAEYGLTQTKGPLCLRQEIVLDLVQGYQTDFALRLDQTREMSEQFFTVKRDIFRILILFVEAVSLKLNLGNMTVFDKLNRLVQLDVINENAKKNISSAICLAYIIRNRAQYHYQEEFEGIFYPQYNPDNYLYSNPYLITEDDRQILNRVYRTVAPVFHNLETLSKSVKENILVKFQEDFLGEDFLKLADRYGSSLITAQFSNESKGYLLQLYRAINPIELEGLIATYRHFHSDDSSGVSYRCALEVYKRTADDDFRHHDAGLALAFLCISKGQNLEDPAYFSLAVGYLEDFLNSGFDLQEHNERYMLAHIYYSDYYQAIGQLGDAINHLRLAKEIILESPLKTLQFMRMSAGDILPKNIEKEGLVGEAPLLQAYSSFGCLNTNHWRSLIKIHLRMSQAYYAFKSFPAALVAIDEGMEYLHKILERGYNANHDIHLLCTKQKASVLQALKQYDEMWTVLNWGVKNQLIVLRDFANCQLFDAVMTMVVFCFESKTHLVEMHHHLTNYLAHYDPKDGRYYVNFHGSAQFFAEQLYTGFAQNRFPNLITILMLMYKHFADVLETVINPAIVENRLSSVLVEENTPKTLVLFCKEALYVLKLILCEPMPNMIEEERQKIVLLCSHTQLLCNKVIEIISPLLESEEELALLVEIAELNEYFDTANASDDEMPKSLSPAN